MEKIIKMVQENRLVDVKKSLKEYQTADIAQILNELDRQKMLILFRVLPKDTAAEVFSYMSYDQRINLISMITDREISSILNSLFIDDTVDFLEELPANVVKKILKNTDENRRKLINQFLKYPQDSAGSIMTIEYVDLKKEMTVEDAIDHIKKTGVDKETIDTCYVINNNRKLEGIISLRKIILSRHDRTIEDIMDQNVISVHTLDDQEKVAFMFKKYDLYTMPVVDKEDRLVGIITIDDVLDVIEQENTEDFQRMAAMEPSDEEYLKTNVFSLAKHRILWLLVLMISATFTGNIIKKYELILNTAVVLTAFIPMLMDTGGNAGSQSSTLVIRGLALGEIKLNDILKVIWKEFRVSLIVGIVLSGLNFVRIYYLEKTDLYISLVVCISLLFTVILAKVVGSTLPIIAKKLKLDPAIMAGPLITTVVDAAALLVYFATASWILGI